jgi:ABC-type amino acid transport substrate-binding protein
MIAIRYFPFFGGRMKVLKFFFLKFFLVGAAVLGAAEEKLVVGMASGYAPYVSLNAKGEYEGFDIDLAGMVAERLHRKLVLQDLGSMPSLLVALKKKKIDAIMWAMSITQDRRKEMNMIYYQGEHETRIPFIFWNKVPEKLAKIEDLANSTICCEAGSSQDAVLRNYPNLKVKYLDKITDALMDIKYHKAETAVIDGSLLVRVQEQYPEIKVAYLPLPESQQSFGNGICLNKENAELTAQVQKVIDDLTKEGKIAELEKKWHLAK